MGRTPGKALDCGGLPWAAANLCGLGLTPTPSYCKLPSGEALTMILGLFCVPCADLTDAHLLQVYFGKEPRHVVVPVGFNECGQQLVIHAFGKAAKVRQTILTDRVHAGWRVRGVR
jgi:hypothetical protein